MDLLKRRSYLCSTNDSRLLFVTLPDLLDQRALESPDKPAHIFRDLIEFHSGCEKNGTRLDRVVTTFKDIADNSLLVAANLLDLGIKPGQRIAVLGNNSPEWLYLEYACLRIKILIVRIPASLMHHDALIGVLLKYRCDILFLDRGQIVQNINKILPGLLDGNLPDEDNKKLRSLRIMFLRAPDHRHQGITVTSMARCKRDVANVMTIQDSVDPDDIAVVLPTTGSTGVPKFCAYSHFKIINASRAAMVGYIPDGKNYAVVALDTSMTWIGGYHFSPVSAGFTFVHIDQSIRFMDESIRLIFQIIKEEQATSLVAFTFMMYDLMRAQKRGNIEIPDSLENVVLGGERQPDELITFVSGAFKSVFIYYGLTEGYLSSRNKPFPDKSNYSTEMMSHFEAKITDDEGRTVPRGVPGNLHIRSPFIMNGFLDDPDSSAKVISPSGWLDTGDVGIIDECGYLDVIGKTKDVISSYARKIYPTTIEAILLKHPKVENAIVVGLPDVELFQVVCACVIPKADERVTEEELTEYCSCSTLESILVPKYFLILENFPKTSNGKVSKQMLIEWAMKHFGL